MRSINFVKQFITHPTQTGAIWPSSIELANVITDAARLSEASVVVEWGPGTGVFTEQILLKKSRRADFLAVELNPEFVKATQARCPTAKVHHASATTTPELLAELNVSNCDIVISGLPWASFPESLQDELLDTLLDVLRPEGRFLTFAYVQGLLLPAGRRFRKKLQSRFSHVTRTRTVWRNTPPAFVYVATK